MSTDREIGEVIARLQHRKIAVCDECGGEGYTDAGTTACGVCFGVGVMTRQLEDRLSACTLAAKALRRIADGTTTTFDEAEDAEVVVWLDAEEMSEIASTAINQGAL